MTEEGAVSLWIGLASDAPTLEQYLQIEYSEDGDFLAPQFCKDFQIRRFDDDFREAIFHAPISSTFRELLRGCSDYDVIVPKFIQMAGADLREPANAAILLYNFRYDGSVAEAETTDLRFRYIGAVKWK